MLSCLHQQCLHQRDEDILVLMKSPPKLSSPHECLNTLVITFIRSHMTASICSCLARPQYFIIPSPLTPHQHNGCVLANWIIMTQNRLCSDSLPARAIHNGFSNTTGLIMVQLVNLKYERKRERPNEGKCGYTWRGKQKQRERKKDDERKEDRKNKKGEGKTESEGGKCLKKEREEAKKEREILMSIYSMLFRSPITLQVSSCDLGGFDRSGSPW